MSYDIRMAYETGEEIEGTWMSVTYNHAAELKRAFGTKAGVTKLHGMTGQESLARIAGAISVLVEDGEKANNPVGAIHDLVRMWTHAITNPTGVWAIF